MMNKVIKGIALTVTATAAVAATASVTSHHKKYITLKHKPERI